MRAAGELMFLFVGHSYRRRRLHAFVSLDLRDSAFWPPTEPNQLFGAVTYLLLNRRLLHFSRAFELSPLVSFRLITLKALSH